MNTDKPESFALRFTISPDGKAIEILDVSGCCESVYEVSAESFTCGQFKIRDFEYPRDKYRLDQWFQQLPKVSVSTTCEFRIVTQSGLKKWLCWSAHPGRLADDGVRIWDAHVYDIRNHQTTEFAQIESEKKFQALVENSVDVIWTGEINGVVTYLSPQFKALSGFNPDDWLGKVYLELTHPDDREAVNKWFNQRLDQNDETDSHEFRLKRHDGTYVWTMVTAKIIYDDTGRKLHQGLLKDISDRKAAEKIKHQFHRMTENFPGMFYRYIRATNTDHYFDFVSTCCLDLFEKNSKEILENVDVLFNLIHPDDIGRISAAIDNSEHELTLFKEEYRVILPTKGLRWHQIHSQPARNENGNTFWDGIVIDITERKATEIALRDSQIQFLRFTDNVPGMLFRYVRRTNGMTELTYVGPQCNYLFGVEAKDALGDMTTIATYIHPDDQNLMDEEHDISLNMPEVLTYEYRVNLPERGECWRQSILHPTQAFNGDVVWEGVVIDITDRKRAEIKLQSANEKLATATKMKDEFLANMSHELRTPLTAVLNMNEGLQRGIFGPVTPEQAESFAVIEESSAHLLELINEILDLAKIESGSIDLDMSEIDINRLCGSSLQLVAQQAEQKNIELIFNAPANPPSLWADEKRMRQILVNLLNNAVKFTEVNGKIDLAVEKINEVSSGSDEMLRFTVTDTGIGIDESKLDTLFEPFVQIDTALNRNHGGIGLGLPLVKQYTKLLGGNVKVNSKPGIGSCFSIYLPYQERQYFAKGNPKQLVTDQTKNQNQHEPTIVEMDQTAALVLLAEDNDAVAKSTVSYLKHSNFRVHRVADGGAALDASYAHSPDIILMDIQMPGVDGLKTINKLRADPIFETTPIIAITGLAMNGDSNRCITAGADHYLSKPYCLQDLVKLIERLLERSCVEA